ncbi:NTP transferase domain-containing protein, partial [Acinetobacter baumannii]|uniref:NTP transferase domain-containing protein n=1 Tax=Acinetobacter baumannii TaxID=470 RepID=UPI00294AC493
MNKGYPITDLVILAGGQARRMNGLNKLLQQFDGDTQLLKIHQKLKSSVSEIWVNSHRDYSIYQSIVPDIKCFQDDASGFFGPLMGMKSTWQKAFQILLSIMKSLAVCKFIAIGFHHFDFSPPCT